MNHGYCKNCFWFLPGTEEDAIDIETGESSRVSNPGYCYMHNGDLGPYKCVRERCYCPDYTNRKKGEREFKTNLQEWIKSIRDV